MQVERGGPLIQKEVRVLAQRWNFDDVDLPPSGARVSNTWVIYLMDWDNIWKRMLIPNKRYVKISLKEAFKASLKDGPVAY